MFDAWKTDSAEESRSPVKDITVIYSKAGEKADAVIKRIISSESRERIVVTSDRDIARHAWSYGSIPISSEEFIDILERPDTASGDFEFMQTQTHSARKKGSPKMLSRKEKAKKRVLAKL